MSTTPPSIRDEITTALALSPATVWPSFKGKYINRNAFLTASEANSCVRKLYYDKTQGHKYELTQLSKFVSKKTIRQLNDLPVGVIPEGWGFFERGHLAEAWLVKQLEVANRFSDWQYRMLGDGQVSYHKGRLSGTPDGVAVNPETDEQILLEFKSYDPRSNTRRFPKPDHKTQVQQNMFIMNKSGMGWDFKRAIIFYLDASNFKSNFQFIVDYDEGVGQQMKQKAASLFAAKDADELEAEGMFNGGCTYCNHTDKCSSVVAATKIASEKEASARKLGDKLF